VTTWKQDLRAEYVRNEIARWREYYKFMRVFFEMKKTAREFDARNKQGEAEK
jgi:hypothetical protein